MATLRALGAFDIVDKGTSERTGTTYPQNGITANARVPGLFLAFAALGNLSLRGHF
jgi:hypothetical protein